MGRRRDQGQRHEEAFSLDELAEIRKLERRRRAWARDLKARSDRRRKEAGRD